MSKEAMKLALEAYLCREMPAGTIIGDPKWWAPKIAMAIDKALAEQPAQQEPVALKWQQAPVKTRWGDGMVVASVAIDKDHTVCLYCERDQAPKVEVMFAQRTWVGLTDEDVRQCSRDVVAGGPENSVDRFAYAIEAKLKEKNT